LSDAGTALETSASLVRELRAALDDLRAQRAPQVAESDERKTIEVPPPQCAEEEDSEELTTIAARPVTTTESAS